MKLYLISYVISFLFTPDTNGQNIPVIVKTSDFSVEFPYWKMDRNYFEVEQKTDSTFFYPELGETPEAMVFKITGSVEIIEIAQHYRTTLSISDEGPHLDLFDWKHYMSFKEHINSQKGLYRIKSYSDNQKNLFPKYSEKDLTDYVKEFHPTWLPLLYKNRKFTTDALHHSVSEIYLTILYTKPGSTKILQRSIVFSLPLGC